MNCIWGNIISEEKIADGVKLIKTNKHGGVAVSQNVKLTDAAKKASLFRDGYYWFEQDKDIYVFAFEYPEYLQSYERDSVVFFLNMFHPEYLFERGLYELIDLDTIEILIKLENTMQHMSRVKKGFTPKMHKLLAIRKKVSYERKGYGDKH